MLEQEMPTRYNTRDLYDHFDKLGIHVFVEPCFCHNPPVWMFLTQHSVDESGSVPIWKREHSAIEFNLVEWDTRYESETAAFTKAFEIREQQLNG